MSPQPVQPNQSVLEGIDLLLEVARRGEPVRVRPLARELGMTPTRLQRYLATLAHAGLLRQHPDASYGVGPGIHALSAVALSASGLTARAFDVLPSLADTGCAVALGVLWRNTVSYLYFSESNVAKGHPLGHTEGYPAAQSVIGLVMLAEKSEADIRTEFPEEQGTILPLIRQYRQQGYTRLRRTETDTSIAVPVGDPAIAGLALTGPLSNEPALIQRLQDAARQLVQEEPYERPE